MEFNSRNTIPLVVDFIGLWTPEVTRNNVLRERMLKPCPRRVERAGVVGGDSAEGQLLTRIQALHAEKEELESMDFDDCLGGACKL